MAAPTFYMGNGGCLLLGTIVVDTNGNPSAHLGATVQADMTSQSRKEIGKWTLKVKANKTNVTHSGTRGWERFAPSTKGGDGTIELPWNFDADPRAYGLYEGNTMFVLLAVGNSGKGHIVPIFIDSVDYDVDNTEGVLMYKVAFTINGETFFGVTFTSP